MDGFRLFSATSGPTKRRKHYLCLLFSQYWVGVESKSKSPHFSEKSIPGRPRLEPHRKVNATTLELFASNFKNFANKRPTCFQTLTFCRNLGFQKPWICPWMFQGFSMDFPPHGFSGRPRERPTKNVGGCGGGGSPPHESLGRALGRAL